MKANYFTAMKFNNLSVIISPIDEYTTMTKKRSLRIIQV